MSLEIAATNKENEQKDDIAASAFKRCNPLPRDL